MPRQTFPSRLQKKSGDKTSINGAGNNHTIPHDEIVNIPIITTDIETSYQSCLQVAIHQQTKIPVIEIYSAYHHFKIGKDDYDSRSHPKRCQVSISKRSRKV